MAGTMIEVERLASDRAMDITGDAASRGYQPTDILSAFVQIVALRERNQIFNYLNALETVVQRRPAILGNAPSSESTQ